MGRVVVELPSPPEPLDACERLAHLPYPLLLDSAADRGRTGRYSYLTADPVEVFQGRVAADPLSAARQALCRFAATPIAELPPFQGGLAGYLAYDYGGAFERLPSPRIDDLEVPDLLLGLYDWVLAWDHLSGRAWVISTGIPEAGAGAERRARHRADEIVRQVMGHAVRNGGTAEQRKQRSASAVPLFRRSAALPPSTFTRDSYMAAVARVRDYILAGDVFQVNISQRFEASLQGTPFELYRRLRARTPAPFAAFMDAGAFQVLSASPERFLRLDGRQVETRPIKGTRPRDADPVRDAELARELESSAKDRAENVMIVDLLRNDLSRVCRPGSVRASNLLALERHPTVHHLVSTVVGELETGRDAMDLLGAAFPGGSITGAPKVRAMEIIAELEPTRRAVYCGTIGYFSVTGDIDTSIVIRTMLAIGGRVYLQAGGGVVADSDPAAEYEETLDKARALIEALAP